MNKKDYKTKAKILFRTTMAFMLNILREKEVPFILMYHRVLKDLNLEPFPIQPGMYVNTNVFEKHINFLRYNYNILSLENMLDLYFKGNDMTNTCAITFDDGWEDNYTNAFPILTKYDICASIFLATEFIGTNKWMWPDELAYLLKNNDKSIVKEILNEKTQEIINVNHIVRSKNDIDTIITKLVWIIKRQGKEAKNYSIKKIMEINNENKNKTKVMLDWNQVKEMKNSNLIGFYPHTHTHAELGELSETEIEYEVNESVNTIEKELNEKNIKIFCYPSGRTNSKIIKILKKKGIKFALVADRGKLKKSINPYEIPRVGVHNDISKNKYLFQKLLND